jgi:signal transduction histidine kinase
MRPRNRATTALRLPRPTLRAQLALLYAALFGVSLVAVAALAVVFKQFLVDPPPGCDADPGAASQGGPCPDLSFQGLTDHDPKQYLAGLVTVTVLTAIALGGGWLIAGRVLRPLRTMTATARDISARNLHQRLAITGPDDEIRQLGQTLDGLFERLEASFQAQRNFVANASHELRTPVSAEKTVLQVALADPQATNAALRSACEKALRWNAQQERLIDSLLTLASTERGIESWEPFDLAGIVARAIRDAREDAERRDISIDADHSAAPTVGDPALVESLITNLVSNAIRHNVDGGRVEVSTAVIDAHAVLKVRNTGPLIPPDEVDRLFQPFQRLGTQRLRQGDGHGLGLAIARAIVNVHNAQLTANARPQGGLDISVSFPDLRSQEAS